ncbi:MAG: carbamoyl phosphate synthase small subunit [Lachnospiraceae bacterium]|nr:carbamoyl phosphate synthase small subunit [Lachnospiraceae bacterium]
MDAFLILEDGTVFRGHAIGAHRETVSEVVFNTGMTGYTEAFTDPSYAGQALCMTWPLIGNYGVCIDDMESERPWLDAVIVRELAPLPSNFRCDMSLQEFLVKYEIPGIAGIDTRKLVRILREKGTMNGMLTTDAEAAADPEQVLSRVRAYTTGRVVDRVTCKEKHIIPPKKNLPEQGDRPGQRIKKQNGTGLRVALLDLGVKRNIAACLAARGVEVTVFPAHTPAEELLASGADGIMLSNGPGDPKDNPEIISEIKKLYAADVPVFAICLGHQLMALATGADTHRLKYGHRGANHPVRDLDSGRVYISSQNHGYVVNEATVDAKVAQPAFVNVNDGTNEGLRYIGKNIFTVQFHPEASPGPHDSGVLFDRFIASMRGEKHMG